MKPRLKKRSYARILWRKRETQLGLLMVNPHQASFFIYAEALISLMKHENNLVLVKKRDRDPEKAIGYHGGAIVGYWEEVPEDPESNQPQACKVVLMFGEVEQKMEYVQQTGEVRHVAFSQEYLFPLAEFEILIESIKTMKAQQNRFDRLAMEAETDPGLAVIDVE